VVGRTCDINQISKKFSELISTESLEIFSILGFENILDYLKIYAIICDCHFIAGISTSIS
jgi:hypothetical protein